MRIDGLATLILGTMLCAVVGIPFLAVGYWTGDATTMLRGIAGWWFGVVLLSAIVQLKGFFFG